MNATQQLTSLEPGMIIPVGGDRYTQVDADLAAAFQPGDRLYSVQDTGVLLHVPAAVHEAVTLQVDAAASAFEQLRSTRREQIAEFYRAFAANLTASWPQIAAANVDDEQRAKAAGRSTTRLVVSEKTRDEMVAGLQGWAERVEHELATGAGNEIGRVDHDDWNVRIVTAPLGVIAFVFEGRPNVLADAAGVVATGNTAVLRIGSDALATAQAICETSLDPALQQAGLPAGTISLIPVRERSAGWALFSDRRLALAVVRGSGRAVTELSSVARQSGIPVSAHGTGGAWMIADSSADGARFGAAVRHSLDRKVCNTLNVAVVAADRAEELIPVLLGAADQAAAARGGVARLHVASGSEGWLPADVFTTTIEVKRAPAWSRSRAPPCCPSTGSAPNGNGRTPPRSASSSSTDSSRQRACSIATARTSSPPSSPRTRPRRHVSGHWWTHRSSATDSPAGSTASTPSTSPSSACRTGSADACWRAGECSPVPT